MGQFTPIIHDRIHYRDDLVFFDGDLLSSKYGRGWDPLADQFQKNSQGRLQENGAH